MPDLAVSLVLHFSLLIGCLYIAACAAMRLLQGTLAALAMSLRLTCHHAAAQLLSFFHLLAGVALHVTCCAISVRHA